MNFGFKITAQEVFEIAYQCKKVAHFCYDIFADGFNDFPEVSLHWLALKNEEEQHLKELDNMKSEFIRKTKNDIFFLTDLKVVEVKPNISDFSWIKRVCNLNDAFVLANEIEYNELNAFFNMFSKETITNTGLVKIIIEEISVHQSNLSKMGLLFGGSVGRKQYPFCFKGQTEI